MAQDLKRLLDTSIDIAPLCEVSPDSVSRWIKNGRLKPSEKEDGLKYVSSEELLQLMTELQLPIHNESKAAQSLRVLVIDDDSSMRKLIRVLLPEYFKNVEVREVGNPSEFEEALKEFKPDLVTLDIKMPGMDGITICTRIKSNPEYSHIKVMAVSGQIRAEMKEKMFKAGADTFLVKPIHPRAIQAKILELFESELIEVIPVEESVEHAQVD